MVALGRGAVSYERGTPVARIVRVQIASFGTPDVYHRSSQSGDLHNSSLQIFNSKLRRLLVNGELKAIDVSNWHVEIVKNICQFINIDVYRYEILVCNQPNILKGALSYILGNMCSPTLKLKTHCCVLGAVCQFIGQN